MNAAGRQEAVAPTPAPPTKEEALLIEIRDLLKQRPMTPGSDLGRG